MSLVLLYNLFAEPRRAREHLGALLHGGTDVFLDPRDPLPLLFQLVAAGSIVKDRILRRGPARGNLVDAYLHDTLWDGEAIG